MKTHRWDFVSVHAEVFGVQRICRVLQVSRSGYYRWIAGAKARAERQTAADALVAEIREVHTVHKGTYGVRGTASGGGWAMSLAVRMTGGVPRMTRPAGTRMRGWAVRRGVGEHAEFGLFQGNMWGECEGM